MRTGFGAACLIVSLVIGWSDARADEAQDKSAQVDRLFAQWDTATSPGCSLSVMKDGHIAYERGYGMADLDHDVKITPASVFHVASVSKQFTAASILMLANDGKLSLDDEARKYVPTSRLRRSHHHPPADASYQRIA